MRVVHAGEAFPEEVTAALFLLGPDAERDAPPWWREALHHLEALGFDGEVFAPDARDPTAPLPPEALRAWREQALQRSDHILVWAGETDWSAGVSANPEWLMMMEAWGFWKARDPARLMLVTSAATAFAEHLRQDARSLGIPVCDTLAGACRLAAAAGSANRQGGEVHVPLHVWRTASFQSWHKAQRDAGNSLCGGHVEWIFRLSEQAVLYWAMQADLHVAAEDRHKANEVVLGRPDVAAVVLYCPASDWLQTEVVLVREFRSPARTPDGYHLGLPSGSSPANDQDALALAQSEVREETGLDVPATRLRRHPDRQLAGTLATYHAWLFSADLSPADIAAVRAREAAHHGYGVPAESERTYPCVRTVREILTEPSVDWSTIGMILAVVR
jgi:8-oxo-dGTP pyrophosphatase MutT (NUDIX family)